MKSRLDCSRLTFDPADFDSEEPPLSLALYLLAHASGDSSDCWGNIWGAQHHRERIVGAQGGETHIPWRHLLRA